MKLLGSACLFLGGTGILLYAYDAKLTGRWDSDGLLLSAGLVAVVILEPPISFAVRGYFARKKAREERERREAEEAERRRIAGEKERVRRERLAAAQAAADEAERLENRRKAAEAWAKKQGTS